MLLKYGGLRARTHSLTNTNAISDLLISSSYRNQVTPKWNLSWGLFFCGSACIVHQNPWNLRFICLILLLSLHLLLPINIPSAPFWLFFIQHQKRNSHPSFLKTIHIKRFRIYHTKFMSILYSLQPHSWIND